MAAAGRHRRRVPLPRDERPEQHRFPEVGRGWHEQDPEGQHPAVAGALCALADQGRLVLPAL
ncbi:hypothetical protein ACWD0J_21710 [Streptomyces sp. NPDC003011]